MNRTAKDDNGASRVQVSRVWQLATRFVHDERGQDLIEYALLASIIAVAGVLLFPTILSKMETTLQGAGSGVNNLWIPNDPVPVP